MVSVATPHSPRPDFKSPISNLQSTRSFNFLPLYFTLQKPEHPLQKLEYPLREELILPYPELSPPPFFIRNHLHDNDIHEHRFNLLKFASVDYQPHAHSRLFHRISALVAPGPGLRLSAEPTAQRLHQQFPPPAPLLVPAPEQLHTRPGQVSNLTLSSNRVSGMRG